MERQMIYVDCKECDTPLYSFSGFDSDYMAVLILSVDALFKHEMGESWLDILSVYIDTASVLSMMGVNDAESDALCLLKDIEMGTTGFVSSVCKIVSFDLWLKHPERSDIAKSYKNMQFTDEFIDAVKSSFSNICKSLLSKNLIYNSVPMDVDCDIPYILGYISNNCFYCFDIECDYNSFLNKLYNLINIDSEIVRKIDTVCIQRNTSEILLSVF